MTGIQTRLSHPQKLVYDVFLITVLIFLQRMAETDEKIKLMSSVREEDKSSVYKKLMEHLGK